MADLLQISYVSSSSQMIEMICGGHLNSHNEVPDFSVLLCRPGCLDTQLLLLSFSKPASFRAERACTFQVTRSGCPNRVTWFCLITLTLGQWQFSGNPVAIQCAWNLEHSVHWNATGEGIVGSQCVSCVPQCVPVMQINTGLPQEHHWVIASASVVQWYPKCTCGSSSLPVCSNHAN